MPTGCNQSYYKQGTARLFGGTGAGGPLTPGSCQPDWARPQTSLREFPNDRGLVSTPRMKGCEIVPPSVVMAV